MKSAHDRAKARLVLSKVPIWLQAFLLPYGLMFIHKNISESV